MEILRSGAIGGILASSLASSLAMSAFGLGTIASACADGEWDEAALGSLPISAGAYLGYKLTRNKSWEKQALGVIAGIGVGSLAMPFFLTIAPIIYGSLHGIGARQVINMDGFKAKEKLDLTLEIAGIGVYWAMEGGFVGAIIGIIKSL